VLAADYNRRELVTSGSDWATMDNARAGQVTIVDSELTGVNASIEISSEAFGYNEPIPELLDKIKGHVIAKGLLIGTYERK
jgi:hypothetical protein